MLQLLAIGIALGAAPERPRDIASVAKVEPVVEHARTDLAAVRRSRTAVTIGLVAPAVNHVGHLAASPLLETSPLDAAGGTAVGLTAASAAGMLVLPTIIDLNAQASRRAIQAQGGTVRRVSLPVVTALLSTAPVLIRGLPQAGEDAEASRVVLAFGAYAAVLALPLHRMVRNRRARERAGWVSRP